MHADGYTQPHNNNSFVDMETSYKASISFANCCQMYELQILWPEKILVGERKSQNIEVNGE